MSCQKDSVSAEVDSSIFYNKKIFEKAYGVSSTDTIGLRLSHNQKKLLVNITDFLDETSQILDVSGHKFLANAAKDLANQISKNFYME